jgi:hypothetical protein
VVCLAVIVCLCVCAVVCDVTACCEKSGPFASTCTADECVGPMILCPTTKPPTPTMTPTNTTVKPTATRTTIRPPVTNTTVTKPPTSTAKPTPIPTTIEGNCFVSANDCPSGQECVPLRASNFYPYDWNPRGVCKPINYNCTMWQVCIAG